MALSQDEQRMLAEIERRLAADDPSLASCLTTFRRPGPAAVLRSPRARIVGSLFTVLLVAMVSLMVYAMIPFRTHLDRHSPPATASPPSTTALSARSTQQSTANVGTRSSDSQSGANHSAAATAVGQSRQTDAKPTSLPPQTPSP
jgi:hypothetical protein